MFGKKLHASGGSEVEVIDPGCLNTDAGPDFFNSKIRIDGVMWAGSMSGHQIGTATVTATIRRMTM